MHSRFAAAKTAASDIIAVIAKGVAASVIKNIADIALPAEKIVSRIAINRLLDYNFDRNETHFPLDANLAPASLSVKLAFFQSGVEYAIFAVLADAEHTDVMTARSKYYMAK